MFPKTTPHYAPEPTPTPTASIVRLYSLTTSTSFAFPTTTQTSPSDTVSFIADSWRLANNTLQNGQEDLAFVSDPYPRTGISVNDTSPSNSSITNSSSTVLRMAYPTGSYSRNYSGVQFLNMWNSSMPLQSVMLSYEVALNKDFDYNPGGMLPGLYGGPVVGGCQGGSAPNTTDCFTTGAKWEPSGLAEVYGYIYRDSGICNDTQIDCNSDYSVSIGRGSFFLSRGQWHRITFLVQLNWPAGEPNGQIFLFFDDYLMIAQRDVLFRNTTDFNIDGLFFSTFFDAENSSHVMSNTTYSYFRNIEMWGSTHASVHNEFSGADYSEFPYATPNTWTQLIVATAILVFMGCMV